MTRRSRLLSEDERALWETVTLAIKPLRRRKAKVKESAAIEQAAVPSPKPVRSPVETPARAKPAQPPAPPPLAPLGRRMRQKLGRGTKPIDDRIDLHGMTQADAHVALGHFLRRAQNDGARVVLVITGKGARQSDDGYSQRGVLRRQVPLWLESAELRPFVVGFESAGAGHGREGALYVRVRRGR
jgi:DNA-nicking Smr family endonuclease